jgi:hypothetical protein
VALFGKASRTGYTVRVKLWQFVLLLAMVYSASHAIPSRILRGAFGLSFLLLLPWIT